MFNFGAFLPDANREGDANSTVEAVKQRRAIARALLDKASDTSPVQHWTQGAARLADAFAGVMEERRANRDDAAATRAAKEAEAGLFGMATGASQPMTPAPQAAPMKPASQGFPASLVQTESGGNWQAVPMQQAPQGSDADAFKDHVDLGWGKYPCSTQ